MSTVILTEPPAIAGGESSAACLSWSAIFAGAAGAAALSLILLLLGAGLGLSSVSPWAYAGIGSAALGVSTIVWITFTQIAASGLGGYLAGRLRSKWSGVRGDETYFRDTAHGFLAWSIATLATAAFLTTAVSTIVGGGVKAAASAAQSVATAPVTAQALPMGDADATYYVDSLFRRDGAASPAAGSALTPAELVAPLRSSNLEIVRIFANSLASGSALPADDLKYVGGLVALRTGLSQQAAEARVNEQFAAAQTRLRDAERKAKELADQTRKATAYAALWLFISLLVGAFVSSCLATVGGRHRDF